MTKFLFFNILFFVTNYIIITDLNGYTSEQRCKAFSQELYKISRPVKDSGDVTSYLFGWIIHDSTNQYAMIVDLETVIPINPENNLTKIISMLNPLATQEEINTIVAKIKTSTTIKFGDILPDYVTIKTYDQMDFEGWFPHNSLYPK